MSTAVDFLAQGPWTPPPGSQLRTFADDFNRPIAGTLGSDWGMMWTVGDNLYVGGRPGSYDCVLNPRIESTACFWGTKTSGVGWSIAWPWKLGWMATGPYDQYAELDVFSLGGPNTTAMVGVVCSANAGSMDPDVYGQYNTANPFRGEYGLYGLQISMGEDLIPSLGLNWFGFGENPSSTPDGLRGHAGMNAIAIPGTGWALIAPLPSTFRVEARYDNGTWNLTVYQNGTVLGTGSDDRILQGCPVMGATQYYQSTVDAQVTGLVDLQCVAIVTGFRGGQLPVGPSPAPRTIFPPLGTQLSTFTDSFVRPDAGTLGPRWGVAWESADYPIEAINRPRPYDAAINPMIVNNRMRWWVRRSVGDLGWAYSMAWPWRLAWLGQGKYDQFAEVVIEYMDPGMTQDGYADTSVELATVLSQAPGSLDPDTWHQSGSLPVLGAYGFYSMSIIGNYYVVVYNCFGATPSYHDTGTGFTRGNQGVQYAVINGASRDGVPFPQTLRMETRWLGDTWEIKTFLNGQLQTTTQDNRLLQGIPALGASIGAGTVTPTPLDLSRLSEFSRFTGGWLKP